MKRSTASKKRTHRTTSRGAKLVCGRYRFDRARAKRVVDYIQSLILTDGEWAGKPIKLCKELRHDIEQIFGWVDAETGYRRYRTAYLEVGRKTGKSEIASAIGTYLLTADDEPGAEIYSAATTKPQATETFAPTKNRIEKQPALRKRLEIYDSVMRIVHPESGSFWQVLSGKVPSAWGFNPHGLLIDELHAHKNANFLNALMTATGARRQPLALIITTAGFDRKSICWKFHLRALKAMKNPESEPTFYGHVYAADEKDDWTRESTWRKANPNYPITPKRDFMLDQVARAKREPSFLNTFKRLHLNIWTQQASRFLPMDKWFECPARINTSDLEGEFCYGGMDLAEVQDLAAVGFIFPPTERRPFWDTLAQHFCPEGTIANKSGNAKDDYEAWVRQGWLTPTPGNSIDEVAIENFLVASRSRFKIGAIGYDRMFATQIVHHLNDAGFKMVPVGMGYLSMTSPTKELLKLVLNGSFRHGDNPILNWEADNLATTEDPAGNVKPAKDASGDKIDGIVAIIMAIFCIQNFGDKPKKSVYQRRGALIFGPGEEVRNELAVA